MNNASLAGEKYDVLRPIFGQIRKAGAWPAGPKRRSRCVSPGRASAGRGGGGGWMRGADEVLDEPGWSRAPGGGCAADAPRACSSDRTWGVVFDGF